MTDQKQIIEINGVKMEVDLRHAKRIDNFKIGDPVKLLISEQNSVHAAIIVDFEAFEQLPTITVAYLDNSYYSGGLKLAHINSKSREKYEIVACDKDTIMMLDKEDVVRRFNRDIEEAEQKLADKKAQKEYFEQRFGIYFKSVETENG